MATALRPLGESSLNLQQTPSTTVLPEQTSAPTSKADSHIEEGDLTIWDDAPSSPFQSEASDKENRKVSRELDHTAARSTVRVLGKSPSKSPTKQDKLSTSNAMSVTTSPTKMDVSKQSPLKRSPSKRSNGAMEPPSKDLYVDANSRPTTAGSASPTKFYSPTATPQASSPLKSSAGSPAKRSLRENEGLTLAIETMVNAGGETVPNDDCASQDGASIAGDIDDTCFSTFSEIPDMTRFARMGNNSPSKQLMQDMLRTPRGMANMTPSTARRGIDDRSSSPTPRRNPAAATEETTNLLLDFTQQIESFSTISQRSPTRRTHSPAKHAESNLLNFIHSQRSPRKDQNGDPGTPGKHSLLNLLDFELPPAPTPRSVPTITVRELESLKSSYLSQISSLNATLSGREAEVDSLKKAVSDAERRVGETQEAVREERNAREHVEKEKGQWEKRGKEVEQVLKDIRKEIISSEREREVLIHKLEESERKVEEAETRAADAEARALEAESKGVDVTQGLINLEGQSEAKFTAEQVQKQLDDKVATLCRELHAVYKKKHETKVSALKKGYEARAEKRAAELQKQIDELTARNDDLQHSKDATFSGVLPSSISSAAELERERQAAADNTKLVEEQKYELQEQRAKLAGLAEEIRTVRTNHMDLMKELEQERIEKGDLVAAVDEMLLLQQQDNANNATGRSGAAVQASTGPSAAVAAATADVEDFRKSISRPSGLRGPGFSAGGEGESRIGRIGAPSMSRSISGGKSKILSNIEKMGSGRTA